MRCFSKKNIKWKPVSGSLVFQVVITLGCHFDILLITLNINVNMCLYCRYLLFYHKQILEYEWWELLVSQASDQCKQYWWWGRISQLDGQTTSYVSSQLYEVFSPLMFSSLSSQTYCHVLYMSTNTFCIFIDIGYNAINNLGLYKGLFW